MSLHKIVIQSILIAQKNLRLESLPIGSRPSSMQLYQSENST